MKPFDAIFPHVRPDVPTCPYPVLIGKIRDAAIEFCRRTSVLREDVQLQTVADSLVYPVGLEGHQVLKLESLTLDGSPVSLPNRATLRRLLGRLDNEQFARLVGDDVVLNRPTANPGQIIVAAVVRVPSDDCTELADELIDRHARDIAWGALELLHGMRKQDWTDPGAEVRAGEKFKARIAAVAIRQARADTSARMPIKAHFF